MVMRVRRKYEDGDRQVSVKYPLPVTVETDDNGPVPTREAGHNFFDKEVGTATTSAKKLVATTYLDATYAFITVETAAIRFEVDGSEPTSSTGHPVENGDTIELDSASEIQRFSYIRRDGVNGVLSVSYAQ